MKKFFALMLAVLMMVSFASCSKDDAVEPDVKGEGVIDYKAYDEAALDSEVTIETYVQAMTSWWQGKATFYTQDKEGAYFLYDMFISQEDYDKIKPGTKLKVKGFKAQWNGQVEIIDATYEFLDGSYVAEPIDLTDKFGTDELAKYQNILFSAKGATVVEITDKDGNTADWLYNWDGSGEEGNDIYFNVKIGENTFSFTIRSYLTDSSTEVYQAAKNLKVGDVIDVEGFLYWYNGANPHITNITVVK